MNTRPCHECGTVTLPMMVVRGPMAFRDDAVERNFCCLNCFWKWTNRAIDERNEGGRLDRQMDWDKVRVAN